MSTLNTKVTAIAGLVLLGAMSLTGCRKPAPTSDATPPTLSFSWIRNDGTQGTIQPGGTATLSTTEAYSSSESIRASADDDEGVKKVSVTWSGTGECSTKGSQPFTAPDPLSFDLPPLAEEAEPGDVLIGGVSVSLRDELKQVSLNGVSCGIHSYQGPPPNQEYFFNGGPSMLTIDVSAENCCGGVTEGTFTVSVQ